MSRRSQRLVTTGYHEDDKASTSSSASLAGTAVSYKESPFRVHLNPHARTIMHSAEEQIFKKKTNSKRSSPALQDDRYSMTSSLFRQSVTSYGNSGSGTSLPLEDGKDIDSHWVQQGNGSVSLRKTRSNLERESLYGSVGSDPYASSGYSSSEENTGTARSGMKGTSSGRSASLFWQVVYSPGKALTMVYWWLGTAWYHMTTALSLFDVFLLSSFMSRWKKPFVALLAVCLLALAMWYFFPFGVLKSSISGSRKTEVPSRTDINERLKPGPESVIDVQLLARVAALERLMESLTAEIYKSKSGPTEYNQKLAEEMGESQKATSASLTQHEALAMIAKLMSEREAILKDELERSRVALMQKELDVLRSEQQKMLEEAISKTSHRSQELQTELEHAKSELKSKTKTEQNLLLKELSRLEEQLSGMRNELKELQKAHWETAAKVDAFPAQMQSIQEDVQSHLPQLVRQVLFSKSQVGDSGQPLASSFIRQEELQAVLRDLEKKILADMSQTPLRTRQQASAAVGATFEGAGVMGVTEEQVNDIVERALQLYSEDRIGLVDYALESAGASVLNTRCSETYETGTALMSLFGIPLWYQSQSPRVIIQPDVNPGNCWAFRGTQGFVVIQLSAEIIPTAVTLEHISKAISPMGSVNTAPRDFAVFGLQNETDHQGTPLGQFTYSGDGHPIQTFPVQNEHGRSYRIIELRVLSNWGHPEYTCIYRFRVHGDPVNRT